MCWTWCSAVRGEITSLRGDLGVRVADRDEAENLDLASGEARRANRAATASPSLPCRLQDCSDAVCIELPRPHLVSELLRGALGAQRRPVRTLLRHRLKRIRGGEDANARGLVSRSGAAVVAGAVQSLVVHARDTRERLEHSGAGEDPLRVVRVQSHLLPLGGGERAWLLPDCVRHGKTADVVQQSRDLELVDRASRPGRGDVQPPWSALRLRVSDRGLRVASGRQRPRMRRRCRGARSRPAPRLAAALARELRYVGLATSRRAAPRHSPRRRPRRLGPAASPRALASLEPRARGRRRRGAPPHPRPLARYEPEARCRLRADRGVVLCRPTTQRPRRVPGRRRGQVRCDGRLRSPPRRMPCRSSVRTPRRPRGCALRVRLERRAEVLESPRERGLRDSRRDRRDWFWIPPA